MSRTAAINMFQFRKDYNKVKAITKTTHERYILEILRGYIIENTIKTEIDLKKKVDAKFGYIDTDMFDNERSKND